MRTRGSNLPQRCFWWCKLFHRGRDARHREGSLARAKGHACAARVRRDRVLLDRRFALLRASLEVGLGAGGSCMGLSIRTATYAALLILRFQLLASRLASRLPFDSPSTVITAFFRASKSGAPMRRERTLPAHVIIHKRCAEIVHDGKRDFRANCGWRSDGRRR